MPRGRRRGPVQDEASKAFEQEIRPILEASMKNDKKLKQEEKKRAHEQKQAEAAQRAAQKQRKKTEKRFKAQKRIKSLIEPTQDLEDIQSLTNIELGKDLIDKDLLEHRQALTNMLEAQLKAAKNGSVYIIAIDPTTGSYDNMSILQSESDIINFFDNLQKSGRKYILDRIGRLSLFVSEPLLDVDTGPTYDQSFDGIVGLVGMEVQHKTVEEIRLILDNRGVHPYSHLETDDDIYNMAVAAMPGILQTLRDVQANDDYLNCEKTITREQKKILEHTIDRYFAQHATAQPLTPNSANPYLIHF